MEFDSEQLTPNQCLELGENTFLPFTQLLRRHTLDHDEYPDLKAFSENYLERTQIRDKLSRSIRNIIDCTTQNENEMKIFDALEAIRHFMRDSLIKDGNLPPHSVPDCCHHPVEILNPLVKMIHDEECENLKIMTMLGGFYVFLDIFLLDYRLYKNSSSLRSEHCTDNCDHKFRSMMIEIFNRLVEKECHPPLGQLRFFTFMIVDLLNRYNSINSTSFILLLTSTVKLLSAGSYHPNNIEDSRMIKCLAENVLKFPLNSGENPVLCNYLDSLNHLFVSTPRPNVEHFCQVEGALDYIIRFIIRNDLARTRLNPPYFKQRTILGACQLLAYISPYVCRNQTLLTRLQNSANLRSILIAQLRFPRLFRSAACDTLLALASVGPNECKRLLRLGIMNSLFTTDSWASKDLREKSIQIIKALSCTFNEAL